MLGKLMNMFKAPFFKGTDSFGDQDTWESPQWCYQGNISLLLIKCYISVMLLWLEHLLYTFVQKKNTFTQHSLLVTGVFQNSILVNWIWFWNAEGQTPTSPIPKNIKNMESVKMLPSQKQCFCCCAGGADKKNTVHWHSIKPFRL